MIKLVNSPLFLFWLVSFFFFLFHVFWQYQVGIGITNIEFYKLCTIHIYKAYQLCERLGKNTSSQMVLSEKEWDISTFPFQDYVWGRHLFFVTKKKEKRKKIHKVHTWTIQPLINLNELQFNKMKNTWLCFLDYNLVKIYKTLFPRLQSKKGKLQGFVS